MARGRKGGAGNINYYPINEPEARRAKEMNSFYHYEEGSATAEYHSLIDKAAAATTPTAIYRSNFTTRYGNCR